MTATPRTTWGVLSHPDFLRFLTARFLAHLASQMQIVAVGWQVYAITRDPLDLGLVGLSQFLPFVLLVLPAGQAADHYDRRRIVTACYAVEFLCAVLLLGFTLYGVQRTWPVFTAMVLFGTARAFAMPTGQALLPNLVPLEDFGRAVALNSSTFQIATVVGPALGGLMYLAGAPFVYGGVAVLFLVAVILMIGVKGGAHTRREREPATWDTLLSGLRFVWSRPVVLGAISLDLFAVLFGGATALLPIYASDIFHVGPAGLGLMRTAPGIGASICAIVLAIVPVTRRVGLWMMGGVAVFGVATIVFGTTTHFPVALAALAVLGAGDMVSVYIRHLLVQLETPDAIRGRVSAVNAVFIGASNELGEFESGITARWFGVVPSVVIGGLATIAVAALWARLFPQLWKMDRFPTPLTDVEDAKQAAPGAS
jgi:MFS family permease